jgi:hypothetical protein
MKEENHETMTIRQFVEFVLTEIGSWIPDVAGVMSPGRT